MEHSSESSQPESFKSTFSKRKFFLVNICAPIGGIILMILSAIVIVIRHSIMDSQFLELIAEKIQERIYEQLGIISGAEKELLCNKTFQADSGMCMNVSTEQYKRFNSWMHNICS